MGRGTSHTTPKAVEDSLVGKYSKVPITLADGKLEYLLLDNKGRVINLLTARNDDNDATVLTVDSNSSLHTTPSQNLKSVAVTSPGVAYANGVNALCLVSPASGREVEIVSLWIAAKAAGDFYLVVDELGVSPGSTTANIFDLVGIKGDGVTDTSDVIWAAFFAAQGRGATGGEHHFDCGLNCEIYLIAPDIDYSFVITWLEEIP